MVSEARASDYPWSSMLLVEGRDFGGRHKLITSKGGREKQPPGLLRCFDMQVLAERRQPESWK